MVKFTDAALIEAARQARGRAYAPYSHFKVGAALLSQSGQIFTGCNIENASYGLTICAERVAIFKALSEGSQQFSKIAVVTGTDALTPPCGACRQIIWEFCGDIPVILANLHGQHQQCWMRTLFPRPFDGRLL